MRLLVVEDVRSLADDIAEGLRDEGIAVDVAYDGLAGRAADAMHLSSGERLPGCGSRRLGWFGSGRALRACVAGAQW